MLVLFQRGVRLRGEALRGWTCCWDWVECGIDISFPERLATQQAGEPYLRGCACWSVKQYTQTPAQRMRETACCCSKQPLMADLGSHAAMAPAGTAGVGRSFTRPLVMDEAGRGYVCSRPENVCTSSTGAAACLASASPCSRQSVPPLDGRIPEALITLTYSPSYLSHQWRRNPSPQQRPPTRHSSGAASAPNRWEGEPGLGGPAVGKNPSISALKRLLQPTIQETRLPAATAPGDGTGGGSATLAQPLFLQEAAPAGTNDSTRQMAPACLPYLACSPGAPYPRTLAQGVYISDITYEHVASLFNRPTEECCKELGLGITSFKVSLAVLLCWRLLLLRAMRRTGRILAQAKTPHWCAERRARSGKSGYNHVISVKTGIPACNSQPR